MIKLVGRLLVASMFLISAIQSLLDGFKSATSLIASKNLPFPFVLAVLGFVAKLLGSVLLITPRFKLQGASLLIVFLLTVMFLFNNPIKDPSKLWMFMALVSVIGGLLLSMDIDHYRPSLSIGSKLW